MAAPVETAIDFGDEENVGDVLTPLMAFKDFGRMTRSLSFFVVNTGAKDVHFMIETSEDGEAPDMVGIDLLVPAGKQGSYDVGPETLRTQYRLAALCAPGDTTTVKWKVKWRSNNV